ncbi:MAG: hypothetical protein IT458_05510 [Planctomycetes bacterium]|nr:hypothetical protein [Planctomycetota bacterium]
MSGHFAIRMPQAPAALRVHRPAAAAGAALRPVQWLEGLEQEAERRRERHVALQALVQQIGVTLQAVPRQVQDAVQEVAAIATELGLAVAREVVGAALERGLVDPLPIVERCLHAAVQGMDGARLRVLLSPEDLSDVLAGIEASPELREHARGVDFAADPRLPRGTVRAETGAGRWVYDPREVLERISAEVRRESHA